MTRLQIVRREVLKDGRSFGASLAWAMACIVAAMLVRLALAPLVDGVPFLTFFPAVLVVAVILGWWWALAVSVASAAVANFLFVEPYFAWAFDRHDIVGTVAFLAIALLIAATGATLREAVREVEQSARLTRTLNSELQHRVKNNLMVVQGLARQTAKSSPAPEAFYAAFSGRLAALGEAHNLLSLGDWDRCALPELLEAALKPFRTGRLVTLSGPACEVPPVSCVPLVLAFHELGTNAMKYGGLSVDGGSVDVDWRVEGSALRLSWQESGGPPVRPPTRRGLGSRLLSSQPGLDRVDLDYRPNGLRCEIEVLGARLSD